MFSSSVRRAAFTVPQTPILSSFTSTVTRAANSQALSYRSHQRRNSSSKPSSPADGSKGVAEGGVPAAPTQARPDGKTAEEARPDGEKKASRSGKRKAKEGTTSNNSVKDRVVSMPNIPSVPSTQHIPSGHICASSFFSLHRPISIHNGFPKPVTEDAFAAIFTPRTKNNTKPAEVISTLSNTLESLDSVTSDMKQLKVGNKQDQWNAETDELRAAITAESYRKAETQHLENPSNVSAIHFPRHILSGKYQPFNPPAAPVPMNTTESLAAGAEAAGEIQEPQQRTYTAVLTIEESTDEHGEVTYMAHSSPLMEDGPPAPTGFLERMNIRREKYRERAENTMLAISVKRQRKLKMKKHKYKKLMRKTRNLRRRLDRN